eukprot:GEMP01002096.1.p1 GENE.GEMP01002096.1~~GEMP01002096.1.p1  ORF type:complete len:1380 (-),score=300.30 GEMP01002096.1:741-4880(-)
MVDASPSRPVPLGVSSAGSSSMPVQIGNPANSPTMAVHMDVPGASRASTSPETPSGQQAVVVCWRRRKRPTAMACQSAEDQIAEFIRNKPGLSETRRERLLIHNSSMAASGETPPLRKKRSQQPTPSDMTTTTLAKKLKEGLKSLTPISTPTVVPTALTSTVSSSSLGTACAPSTLMPTTSSSILGAENAPTILRSATSSSTLSTGCAPETFGSATSSSILGPGWVPSTLTSVTSSTIRAAGCAPAALGSATSSISGPGWVPSTLRSVNSSTIWAAGCVPAAVGSATSSSISGPGGVPSTLRSVNSSTIRAAGCAPAALGSATSSMLLAAPCTPPTSAFAARCIKQEAAVCSPSPSEASTVKIRPGSAAPSRSSTYPAAPPANALTEKFPMYRCKVDQIPVDNPHNPHVVGVKVFDFVFCWASWWNSKRRFMWRHLRTAARLLLLIEIGSNRVIWVSLCGDWARQYRDDPWMLIRDDIVHLITPGLANPNVDHIALESPGKSAEYIIFHPDLLITGTMASNTLDCPRQALLQDEYPDFGLPSRALILGVVVHEVFQVCMAAQDFGYEFRAEQLKELFASRRVDIWAGDVDENELFQDGMDMLENGHQWAQLHYEALREHAEGGAKISQTIGVEQSVSSHRFGFKGKFDLLVKNDAGMFGVVELKTGKQCARHLGQVAVYYLLLNDLFQKTMDELMLLYLTKRECTFDTKKVDFNMVRHIVMNRNYLASLLMRRRQTLSTGQQWGPLLPNRPFAPSDRACQHCYRKNTCFALASAFGEQLAPPMVSLDPETKNYLVKWISNIDAEAIVCAQEREAVMTSTERALCGLRSGTVHQGEDGFWQWSFFAADPITHFGVGDQVQISKEGGPYHLYAASVVSVESRRIVVRVKFEVPRVMCSEQGNRMCHTQLHDIEDTPALRGAAQVRYRIDPGFFGGGWAKQRGSLMALLNQPRLKELLVLDRPPTFSTTAHAATKPRAPRYETLNSFQKQAVDKVFTAEDFCIIAGYPGTGKTEVLAALLECLVNENLNVLLCAYTNAAVDNVLLRLIDSVHFVRVGNPNSMHKDIHRYRLPETWNCAADVGSFAKNCWLTACTCHSASDSFIQKQEFDVVVIDEASQCTEPVVWCPLMKAKRFVLIGDTHQLAPLVRHPHSVVHKMNVSLMERLSNLYPHAVVELTLQYRMNEDVQLLPNILCYNGKLACATEAVQRRQLKCVLSASSPLWVQHALSAERSVVFCDTNIAMRESENKASNPGEVSVVSELVSNLIAGGVSPDDIAVLSPYRSQIACLRKALADKQCEVLTVDQSQGRDKACVIVSLVRSNPDKNVGDLLEDWRRLNVLLTRAKCKLLLVGSMSTFLSEKNSNLKSVLTTIKTKNWVVDVTR